MAEAIETEIRAPSRNVGQLRALLPFFRPYRWSAFAAVIALLLTASLMLVLPLIARNVVDGFSAGDIEYLDQNFRFAILVAAIFALGTGVRFFLVTRLGERVIADIRKAIFHRMIGMSPAYYETLMTGEVLSRITTDTTLILNIIGSSISWFLRNILTLIGALILMFWTSPILSLYVVGSVPLIMLPIIFLGRRLRGLSKKNQDWIATSSGKASEAFLAVQTVQAFTAEGRMRAEFDEITEESYRSARARIIVRAALTMSVIFIAFSGILWALWSGATFVQNGSIGAGQLVQFVIYAMMAGGSVASLSELWSELQRAAGATERMIELLQAEDPLHDGVMPVADGTLAFRDVHFAYPQRSDIPALKGVSFTLNAGETVALVGPSGAGKSTIIQLAYRFFDPNAGQVTLGGVDLHDMPRAQFRKKFALVPQEPVIFSGSAFDNIQFGRPDATGDEVIAAAKAAAAHGFISALPDGYNSAVGERGVMLSGGQKQRIAIARAILRNAPVLLLDEATSALDAESEAAVQGAFEQMAQDRTVLVIAHRLATVKKADRILVMDQGQIIAQGTHDELVSENGLYARLAKLQFTESQTTE